MKKFVVVLLLLVSARSFASGSVGSADANALKTARSRYMVQFKSSGTDNLGLGKAFVEKFVENAQRHGLQTPSKRLAPWAFFNMNSEPGIIVSIASDSKIAAPQVLERERGSVVVIGAPEQISEAAEKLEIYIHRSYGYRFSVDCPIRQWYGCI